MRLAIWAVWAAEPEDLSLLSVLFYIRSAGSFEALIDTEGGAQDSRVVGGSQAISLRMAEELEDSIVLDAPVQRIEHATGSSRSAPPAASRSRPGGRSSPCRRSSPGGSPTTRRCPPSATGSPSGWRWAAWSSAWRSIRSRSGGPTDSRGRRPAPMARSPSPTTTPRPTARPACCSPSSRARRREAAADLPQPERRAIVLDCLERFFGARAAEPERYLDKAWAADPTRPAATGAFCPPAPGSRTGPRCAPRSGRSTGPAPRPRPCGAATWTAPLPPASAPPPRRSRRWGL